VGLADGVRERSHVAAARRCADNETSLSSTRRRHFGCRTIIAPGTGDSPTLIGADLRDVMLRRTMFGARSSRTRWARNGKTPVSRSNWLP
jgi:hypothetical protein